MMRSLGLLVRRKFALVRNVGPSGADAGRLHFSTTSCDLSKAGTYGAYQAEAGFAKNLQNHVRGINIHNEEKELWLLQDSGINSAANRNRNELLRNRNELLLKNEALNVVNRAVNFNLNKALSGHCGDTAQKFAMYYRDLLHIRVESTNWVDIIMTLLNQVETQLEADGKGDDEDEKKTRFMNLLKEERNRHLLTLVKLDPDNDDMPIFDGGACRTLFSNLATEGIDFELMNWLNDRRKNLLDEGVESNYFTSDGNFVELSVSVTTEENHFGYLLWGVGLEFDKQQKLNIGPFQHALKVASKDVMNVIVAAGEIFTESDRFITESDSFMALYLRQGHAHSHQEKVEARSKLFFDLAIAANSNVVLNVNVILNSDKLQQHEKDAYLQWIPFHFHDDGHRLFTEELVEKLSWSILDLPKIFEVMKGSYASTNDCFPDVDFTDFTHVPYLITSKTVQQTMPSLPISPGYGGSSNFHKFFTKRDVVHPWMNVGTNSGKLGEIVKDTETITSMAMKSGFNTSLVPGFKQAKCYVEAYLNFQTIAVNNLNEAWDKMYHNYPIIKFMECKPSKCFEDNDRDLATWLGELPEGCYLTNWDGDYMFLATGSNHGTPKVWGVMKDQVEAEAILGQAMSIVCPNVARKGAVFSDVMQHINDTRSSGGTDDVVVDKLIKDLKGLDVDSYRDGGDSRVETIGIQMSREQVQELQKMMTSDSWTAGPNRIMVAAANYIVADHIRHSSRPLTGTVMRVNDAWSLNPILPVREAASTNPAFRADLLTLCSQDELDDLVKNYTSNSLWSSLSRKDNCRVQNSISDSIALRTGYPITRNVHLAEGCVVESKSNTNKCTIQPINKQGYIDALSIKDGELGEEKVQVFVAPGIDKFRTYRELMNDQQQNLTNDQKRVLNFVSVFFNWFKPVTPDEIKFTFHDGGSRSVKLDESSMMIPAVLALATTALLSYIVVRSARVGRLPAASSGSFGGMYGLGRYLMISMLVIFFALIAFA